MNSNAELKARTEEIRNDIERMVKMCGLTCGSDILDDYLDDAEVEYRTNSSLEYISAYIYIEAGGPTTWIDTYNNTINSSWGNYKASVYLSFDVIELLNNYFREVYYSTRGL